MLAASFDTPVVVAVFERMSRAAFWLALLASAPVAMAQDGRVAVECVDVAHPQDTLSFVLDFDRQAVAGAFPINWAWFTRAFVLFQYSTLINGHQHTTQSYSLDRATGVLEICDFAASQEQACSHRPCAFGQWDAEAALPAAARAGHTDQRAMGGASGRHAAPD